DVEQIREHLVAGDVEDLPFEGVEDPAGRGNDQDEPLVARDVPAPGARRCRHQSPASIAAASFWPAVRRSPSTISWPQDDRVSRPRLLRTRTRTRLSASCLAKAWT